MKHKPLFESLLLVILGVVLTEYGQTQGTGAGKIAVLNPAIAPAMAKRIPLPPRLDALEGKTLYMVDIKWGDSATSIYEEMRDWFAKNMPSVKPVIKSKNGSYSQDDPELWKEIAQNGQAAIIGIAG